MPLIGNDILLPTSSEDEVTNTAETADKNINAQIAKKWKKPNTGEIKLEETMIRAIMIREILGRYYLSWGS